MGNLFSRGVIFYDFHPIVGSTRWLAIFKFNQTSYVTSLSMGDYYCGVRKFWLSSVWCLRMETSFWVQNGVQMTQRKETHLTFQTANAFCDDLHMDEGSITYRFVTNGC